MIDPAEVERHRLSDAENRRIFRERIVPDLLAGRVEQETPTVVFLVGQPGAGKSRVTEMVAGALNRHGGFADVDSDLYKPYHPAYARLMAEDDTLMAAYTRADGRAWMAQAEAYVREHGLHAIIQETILELLRRRGDRRRPELTIDCTVQKDNADHVHEMVEFAERYGADVQFDPAQIQGYGNRLNHAVLKIPAEVRWAAIARLKRLSASGKRINSRGNLEIMDGRWGASLEIGPHPGDDPALGRHPVPAGGRWGAVHPYFADEPRLLLYDLEKDPDELESVYGRSEYADVVKQMKAELKTLRTMYGVPEDEEPALGVRRGGKKKAGKASG